MLAGCWGHVDLSIVKRSFTVVASVPDAASVVASLSSHVFVWFAQLATRWFLYIALSWVSFSSVVRNCD